LNGRLKWCAVYSLGTFKDETNEVAAYVEMAAACYERT
jgi:hypothetical protein